MAQLRRLREEGVGSDVTVEETAVHGDVVIVRFRWRVTGTASGLSDEHTFSATYRVRDGLIDEVHFYWQHAEALEAVGLRE